MLGAAIPPNTFSDRAHLVGNSVWQWGTAGDRLGGGGRGEEEDEDIKGGRQRERRWGGKNEKEEEDNDGSYIKGNKHLSKPVQAPPLSAMATPTASSLGFPASSGQRMHSSLLQDMSSLK